MGYPLRYGLSGAASRLELASEFGQKLWQLTLHQTAVIHLAINTVELAFKKSLQPWCAIGIDTDDDVGITFDGGDVITGIADIEQHSNPLRYGWGRGHAVAFWGSEP